MHSAAEFWMIEPEVAFFEIETERFAAIEAKSTQYKEPSKFPAIEIDITFNTGVERLDFDKIIKIASASADGMLKDLWLHDVYEKEDGRAVTLRFSFEAKDRTLSKQELAPITDEIAKNLASIGMVI